MAVDNNIDIFFFKNTQVNLAEHRRRSAEHDILKIGSQHAAAPTISQSGPGSLLHQALIVLVYSHMSAVHGFDYFSIDTAGNNSQLTPDFLTF